MATTREQGRNGHVIDRARTDEVMVYSIGLESKYFNGQRQVRSARSWLEADVG